MDKEFDVVVVGGRCAGSPLATLLARAGLSVALVEQATFPRDTLSTHVFESAALAFLNRLGVLSALRATGAPIVNHLDIRQEGFRAQVPVPQQPGDVGGVMSVRRLLLDPILAEAAAEAGAEVWMGAKVTALVRDRGRVTGVRVAHNGSEQSLEARLVVGADGRNSTVARLAGSRKYNLTPNERFFYWSFFEDADPGAEPTVIFHRWSGTFVVATTDGQRAVSGARDARARRAAALPAEPRGKLPGVRPPLRPGGSGTIGRTAGRQALRDAPLGGVLPRGDGAGVGTGRRRWPFQGPRPRPGHSRRVPAGRVPGAGDPRRHQQVAVRAGRGARGLGALAR